MSNEKRWGGHLVRLEHLSPESSHILEDISSGGGSTGKVSDIGTERSSFVSFVTENSSITVTEVFFHTWSKCLRTLLPSVRSTVNEEGPVLECMTPESHGSPALKFLTRTESPSTNTRSLAWKSCNSFCRDWFDKPWHLC